MDQDTGFKVDMKNTDFTDNTAAKSEQGPDDFSQGIDKNKKTPKTILLILRSPRVQQLEILLY